MTLPSAADVLKAQLRHTWMNARWAAWTDVYRHWTFDDERPTVADADVPGNASEGLARLYDSQDQFMRAVDALDDVSVFELRPAHWGESVPVVNLVSLMLAEHVHHIAEVGVLRDLHRGHARIQPLPS